MNNIFPTKYIKITNNYSSSHKGIDFGWSSSYGGSNVSVFSINDGVVYKTEIQKKGGYCMYIKHDNGMVSLYAHLKKNSYKFKVGDRVNRGSVIANMGGTGVVTGNHVHLSLYKNTNLNDSNKVNPLPYLYANDSNIINSSTKAKYKINYESNQQSSNNNTDNSLKVGDKVQIIGNYASSSTSTKAVNKKLIGATRYILKIYQGRNYPYQVGNTTGVSGYFKANSLKKLS